MLRSAARLSRQLPTSSRTVVSRSISSTLSLKSKVLETSPSVRPSPMTATINGHGSEYTPFLLSPVPGAELRDGVPAVDESDWTSELDLSTATEFSRAALRDRKLKVLVLYGSLRERCVNLRHCFDPLLGVSVYRCISVWSSQVKIAF